MTRRETTLWLVWGLLAGLLMQIALEIYKVSPIFKDISNLFSGNQGWALFASALPVMLGIYLVKREIDKEKKNRV